MYIVQYCLNRRLHHSRGVFSSSNVLAILPHVVVRGKEAGAIHGRQQLARHLSAPQTIDRNIDRRETAQTHD